MLSDVGCGQDHKQPEVEIEVHVTALFINIRNCKKKKNDSSALLQIKTPGP
jgi:hypothetical protein